MKMSTVSNVSIRWAFNVKDWTPTKEQFKSCIQCIQKEENERCNKFAFKEDCKSSMIGQLLMRKGVNESTDIPYDKIIFARTSAGKPYLVGQNCDVSFNVSHNGDFCVFALEKNITIGVDVMKVEHRGKRPLSEYFSLMRKQFSSSEWDFISLPGIEKEQLERFYRLWCLKESYVKATGTGIAYDLQTLSFFCATPTLKSDCVTTDTKLFIKGQHKKEWTFEEMLLKSDHCLAVAVGSLHQETNSQFNWHTRTFNFLSIEELLRNSVPFVKEEENFWENFSSKSEKTKL